jgi:hypothetical protein
MVPLVRARRDWDTRLGALKGPHSRQGIQATALSGVGVGETGGDKARMGASSHAGR